MTGLNLSNTTAIMHSDKAIARCDLLRGRKLPAMIPAVNGNEYFIAGIVDTLFIHEIDTLKCTFIMIHLQKVFHCFVKRV